MTRSGRTAAASAVAALIIGGTHAGAAARPVLDQGDVSPAVRFLEVRVVGWFDRPQRTALKVDRRFTRRTTRAVKAFQRHYGLLVDGIVGPQTWRAIDRLQDADGSTAHFSWAEFKQRRDPACPRAANRYAGSFRGGRVDRVVVKRHIRRLMWRLEAMRARARKPVLIDSGFRSRPYNRCMGGARHSQHLYGAAVDIDIVGLGAAKERRLARRSQFHGIACYSHLRHTHLDIRRENAALMRYRHFWWPDRNARGRELSSTGRPCRRRSR